MRQNHVEHNFLAEGCWYTSVKSIDASNSCVRHADSPWRRVKNDKLRLQHIYCGSCHILRHYVNIRCGRCLHDLFDEIIGEFEITRLKGFLLWWTCQTLERLCVLADVLLRNSKASVRTPRTLELIPGAIRRFNYSMLESSILKRAENLEVV